jgi:hypothetical protein
MKKNLNEEISRIKTLLNIKENNLILEANPILSIIRRLAPSVEARFITGIETRLGKKIASATDAEVTTALKHTSMASVRMEIAEAIYLVEKNSIDNILSKYNMSVPGEASRAYSELSAKGYNSAILKDIKNVYNAGKTSGGAGGSSAGGNTTGTIPGPSNNNPHVGGDDFGNVDDLFKNTYKTSPAFQVFYHMVDNISQTVKLSKLDREKILLAWKQYGNHTPAQLEVEAKKLVNTRKLEQYGWLKKLIAKGMEDPSKTIKIGGKTILALSLWVPLAYAGIVLGLFGIAKVTIFKNWINNNTNDPDVKDALLNSVNSGGTGGIGDIPQNP